MKAIVMNHSGGADQLKVLEHPGPTVADGYVKIKTEAFGLNRAEVYVRSGAWGEVNEPRILGIEAVGTIVEDKSGNFAVGQKVITAMGGLMLARDGSYAEYITAPVSNVLAVDTNLPWHELAAIPEAYLTIWGALDKNIGIKEGQRLLVRGATTTLGLAAIIYAKARGLEVIATTRRPENKEVLISKGADDVIIDDGDIADKVRVLFPDGVDNAIDIVGASTVKDTLKTVKEWGEVCVVGILTGSELGSFDVHSDLPNTVKLSFFASGLLGSAAMPFSDSPIQWIADQIERKRMPSTVSHVFNFEDIQAAHETMENDQAKGKIVITI